MDSSTLERSESDPDALYREVQRTELIVNLIIATNILLVVVAVVPTFVYWIIYL